MRADSGKLAGTEDSASRGQLALRAKGRAIASMCMLTFAFALVLCSACGAAVAHRPPRAATAVSAQCQGDTNGRMLKCKTPSCKLAWVKVCSSCATHAHLGLHNCLWAGWQVHITGKYGVRYGASLRKQIKKIEISQHAKYTCGCKLFLRNSSRSTPLASLASFALACPYLRPGCRWR